MLRQQKARYAFLAIVTMVLLLPTTTIAIGPSVAFFSPNLPPALIDQLGILGPNGINACALAPNQGFALVTSNNNFITNGVPKLFSDKLEECINSKRNVRNIAFSPDGGWVIVTDNGTFWHQVNEHCINALKAATQKNQRILCVTFGPNEGWIVITNQELYRGNIPADLFNKMQNFAMQGGIHLASLAPGGGAFVFADGTRFYAEATPIPCIEVMQKTAMANRLIDVVSFSMNGAWVVITSNSK